MNIEEIKKELRKAKTFNDVTIIAENLICDLIPVINYRIFHNSLDSNDIRALGYTLYEVSVKADTKDLLIKKLLNKGFLYTYDIYFHPKRKEAWTFSQPFSSISSYVSLDGFGIDTKVLLEFITLKEYIDLLANKILNKYQKWIEYKNFVNSLIEKEKRFYEEELEESKRNMIIEEAIEEARRRGLIK